MIIISQGLGCWGFRISGCFFELFGPAGALQRMQTRSKKPKAPFSLGAFGFRFGTQTKLTQWRKLETMLCHGDTTAKISCQLLQYDPAGLLCQVELLLLHADTALKKRSPGMQRIDQHHCCLK